MFARISTIQGDPGKIEEGIRMINDEVIPTARKIPGFKGGTWLADRKTGKTIAVTFWASEGELKASEDAVSKLRADALKRLGSETLTVEAFEVVAQA